MSHSSSACMAIGPYYIWCGKPIVKGGNNRAGATSVSWKLCVQQIKAPPGWGPDPTSVILSPSTGCVSAQDLPTGPVKFLPKASGKSLWPVGSISECNEMYLHSVLICQRQKWLWFDPAHSIPSGSMDIRICFVEHQGRKPGLWNYLYIDVYNQKYTDVDTCTSGAFSLQTLKSSQHFVYVKFKEQQFAVILFLFLLIWFCISSMLQITSLHQGVSHKSIASLHTQMFQIKIIG